MSRKKGPFKMKPSTFKQKEHLTAGEIKAQKKFGQKGVDLTLGIGDAAWMIYEGFDKKYKKPAKNILSKMWRGGSKALGALAVPSLLYDFHQSGQKHSGGRIGYKKNPNYDPNKKGPKHGDIGSNAQFIPTKGRKHHEGFMAESKKKTKSIFNKKKKK